jgi:hypothetical protein
MMFIWAGIKVKGHINQYILDKWSICIDEIASELSNSGASAYKIIHDELAHHKVCARLVSKQLTDVHETTHFEVRTNQPQGYQDGDIFLNHKVNRDETWIHQNKPESKK